MIALLLDLTVRGTLATLVVLALDWSLTRHMRPPWRRAWWILVALAWLLPLRLARFEALPRLPLPDMSGVGAISQAVATTPAAPAPFVAPSFLAQFSWLQILGAVWLAGAVVALGVIVVRTVRTARRWNQERLCTDPDLLNLLEDCKALARITAPIGLVVTDSVSTPALLGWLRPRILLPRALIPAIPRDQLRGILLHELAHFRSADIQLHWLFTLAQALHWFNPAAYLAVRRWRQFRELAADDAAIGWMPVEAGQSYGGALINALRHAHELPIPRGALALGESIEHLQERIALVARGGARRSLSWLAALVVVALAGFIALPSRAREKMTSDPTEAIALTTPRVEQWLKLVDDGRYTESWNNFSVKSKQALSSQQWVNLVAKTRTLFGELRNRTFVFAKYRNDLDKLAGVTVSGEFVEFFFDSSYERLPAARECILVTLDPDGQWRISTYVVKPR